VIHNEAVRHASSFTAICSILVVPQLVKKLPACYAAQRFITTFIWRSPMVPNLT